MWQESEFLVYVSNLSSSYLNSSLESLHRSAGIQWNGNDFFAINFIVALTHTTKELSLLL